MQWVARKQKSHRSVSESAMKALEARSKGKLQPAYGIYINLKFCSKNLAGPQKPWENYDEAIFWGYKSNFEVNLWPKFFPCTLAN